MKSIFVIAGMLCFGISTALSQNFDKRRPSGRACLAIANSANGDEEVLRPVSTAGKNQKIVAHLDATAGCEVLVAPFLKSGELVPGWLPQYVKLSPALEALIPKVPVSWSWENDSGSLEIFVLFMTSGSKKSGEIRELVNAMGKERGANIIKLQGGKLRELMGSANIERGGCTAPAQSELGGGRGNENGGGL